MPRKLHVAMDELLDAMEERSDSVVPYFNRRTGAVDFQVDPDFNEWPQLDPDDPDWVEIPRVESRDAFRTMQSFVDGIDELDVKRRLQRALEGRGAFRRFRETLAGYPDLLERRESTHRSYRTLRLRGTSSARRALSRTSALFACRSTFRASDGNSGARNIASASNPHPSVDTDSSSVASQTALRSITRRMRLRNGALPFHPL